MASNNNQFDIISNLPQDVIQCILERLRIKDAVKTSALSKSWRYSWRSITKLVFDGVFFSNVKIHERSTLAQKILQQHVGRLRSVIIDTRYYEFSDYLQYLELGKTILKFVSSKGVKCFKIATRREYRNDHIFTPLFSCSELTDLTIKICTFSVPDSSFRGFTSLVNLKFKYVQFCDNSLEDLINNCPLLESLSLVGCRAGKIIIPCPGLKHFNISSHTHFPTVTIVSHNLESLCVFQGGRMANECRLIIPPTLQNSLKKIYFQRVGLYLQGSLATNVLDIEISFIQRDSWDDEIRKFIAFVKFSIGQMQLRHVEYLKMELRYCCEEELDLVNMFLAETSSVKEIVVVDRSYKSESEDNHSCRRQSILDKLQFRRLSPRAQLVFKDL